MVFSQELIIAKLISFKRNIDMLYTAAASDQPPYFGLLLMLVSKRR